MKIKLEIEVEGEKGQDECGVLAIRASRGNISADLMVGLMSLQHRGQESAGMATFDGAKIHNHRSMGLVSEVFDEPRLESLPGSIGIAHVRYSTTGESAAQNAQPLPIETKAGRFVVGLNGNLVNYHSLRADLEARGYSFSTTTDTECLGYLLAEEMNGGVKDAFTACGNIMKLLDGAYCFVVLMENGEVVVMRDPTGFRPLCIGKRGDADVVASETTALDALEAKFVRYVQPGEVLLLDGGMKSKIVGASPRVAHCMFEWVYVARPDSVVEGKSVIDVREKFGEELSAIYLDLKSRLDVVVPIPDSGRSAAYAYSRATGVRLAEALQKNRYVHRTFIMPGGEKRKRMVKLKLNVIAPLVAGKRVALVDDSIVRGTTMRRIVERVREAGAKEVHLLITCPAIISPCFMGVDFPTFEELATPGKTVERLRRELNVDSLNYMTHEGLARCIGLPKDKLCMACINGDYPLKTKPDIRSPRRCD
ncbi:amidophosphoribosyltransferase [Candidatus Micrarchaeota archaeon]|nr:amidophosphoribosyltransferase [Candidatus Micrarchaeota archaeon]